ncbi:MAG: hypothetical protein OEQ74_05130 [Gammaproteobacteria bacterium]|nr:hypothetical protein [Gammaproteobacteria bacterium]
MKHRTALLVLVLCGFATTTHATTWDLEGVVDQCDPLACDLAGITVGEPIAGYITADDAASGPGSTFGAADITDYGIQAQGVAVGPADSTLVSATLTTDGNGELESGTMALTGQIDGGIFGLIDLAVSIDVGKETWTIETDFLGLGVVASGPGNWFLEADGDGLAAIQDNCTEVANPAQRDTDIDGIGNFCDPDFDQNCSVDFLDVATIKQNFLLSGDLVTDLDGDGITSFPDVGIAKQFFLADPGPSGVPNICDGN